MSADILQLLLETTLASSAAIVLARALRWPMRWLAGARAAYWLWMLVPAMLIAVLLPLPSTVFTSVQMTLTEQMRSTFAVVIQGDASSSHAWLHTVALAVWAAGASAMVLAMILRQRSFVRSLGILEPDAQGLHRCTTVTTPMIVGAWNSRIVVPADFESRYSAEKRELVLAHERAHASRRDVAVNAVASLAACLFWFNPLMHRALAWLREDQEFACDALVLARRGHARRRYADILLRTQLAAQFTWDPPLGCRWQSTHPLKERIYMLSRSSPHQFRRRAGVAFIASVICIASYATWAAQSRAAGDSTVLVDLKVTITNPQTKEVKSLATQYLVASGEKIKDQNGRPLDFSCTPYLADGPGRSTNWSAQRARGIPAPQPGQILLDCTIRQNGQLVGSPAMLVADGQSGAAEATERGGSKRYRLEVSASTSPERIAAARKPPGT